jgi:hypothetical protein
MQGMEMTKEERHFIQHLEYPPDLRVMDNGVCSAYSFFVHSQGCGVAKKSK